MVDVRLDVAGGAIASIDRPVSHIPVQEVLDFIDSNCLEIDFLYYLIACHCYEILMLLKIGNEHAVVDDIGDHDNTHEDDGRNRDKLLISL